LNGGLSVQMRPLAAQVSRARTGRERISARLMASGGRRAPIQPLAHCPLDRPAVAV